MALNRHRESSVLKIRIGFPVEPEVASNRQESPHDVLISKVSSARRNSSLVNNGMRRKSAGDWNSEGLNPALSYLS
jgi:hypothetical protein